ncbi:hypothetical protein ACIBHX_33870 [Nonomuraea sp. NPDC050536]|uniref:hypothetical protein n=1 Tax=Nonomuraea sp. NPDC050536 TaxID=3364366 RepID=UPI0037C85D67
MSLLERRYRSVLRLLPASYRAVREEEMVSAFMEFYGEVPDEENPRPRWSEVASVLALSTRLRLGAPGAGPRFAAWGAAVRLVAQAGLLFEAVMGLLRLAREAIFLSRPHHGFDSPFIEMRASWAMYMIGWSLAVVAFLALASGGVRTAKVAAGVECVLVVAAEVVTGDPDHLAWRVYIGLLNVPPVLALFAAYHRDAPAFRLGRWRAVGLLVAPTVLYVLLQFSLDLLPYSLWLSTWTDPAALAVCVGFCLALRRSASARLGVAILAGLLLLVQLPSLMNPSGDPENLAWIPGAAQCGLLGAIVLVSAVSGVRALPAVSP